MAGNQIVDTVKAASYKKPKTILGFFLIALAILTTGGTGTVAILSHDPGLHYIVPWVLGFIALAFVATVAGVFITAWRDPTILMLGQISGQDYLANRRLTLGDSDQGEYMEYSTADGMDVLDDVKRLPVTKMDEGDTDGG